MLRVLIVDDEPRHRRVLASVIESLRPEYEVLSAKNGKEALEIVDSRHIHIIITDIKMPGMDGLTFMDALGDRIKNMKVIILSGFASFEYAQKAMNLGASDFILKPFDVKNIDEVLKKVECEIMQESIEEKEKEDLRKQLDEIMPEYLEHRFNQWICGYIKGLELSKLERLFPYKGAGAVLLLEISKCNKSEYSANEFDEINTNIKTWMTEVLNPIGHTISFFLENAENTMVTILDTNLNNFEITDNILKLLNELINNLIRSYELDFTIGIGSVHENIFRNAIKSFDNAKKALSLKFFNSRKKVLSYSDINLCHTRKKFLDYEQLEELKKSIRNCDSTKMEILVGNYFEELKSGNYLLPSQFIDLVIHTVADVIKSIQSVTGEDFYNDFILEKKDLLKKCEDYSSLKKEVINILNYIITQNNADSRGHKKIITICKKYIDEHYMDDLSLDYMSEKFNLNANYFSTFFKNNTGVKFTDYLQSIRMNKAKELLERTDLRIYEIAEKVGYHDVKYFIKVFKKEFNTSPDEYRRVFNVSNNYIEKE